MTKEQKGATIKFLLWFITLSIICFIGMNDIFALSNYNQIQFYDNNGSSVSWKSTSWVQQTQESTATFGLTANSTGGLLVYMMSSPVVNNHIYSMFVNVGSRNYGGATQLSSKNCIGLGNSEVAAANDYIACTLTPRFSASSGSTSEYRKGLFFTFIANKNAGYIAIPFTSTETVYDVPIYSYGLEMEDNGDSTNMTQQEVSNIVDTQTDTLEETIANIESNVSSNILNSQQAIISNQNANNNALIQSNQTNTDSIISNNNTNTDKIIADNKKNFQTCRDSVNLFNINSTYKATNSTVTLNETGFNAVATGGLSRVVFPISVVSGRTYNISFDYTSSGEEINPSVRLRKLNNGGDWISGLGGPFTIGHNSFTLTATSTGDYFIWFYFNSSSTVINYDVTLTNIQFEVGHTETSYEKYGEEICTNKLDEQTKTSKGILGKLGDLFTSFGNFVSNLFDTSGPDTDSISGMAGWLPPGPVDSILNLPLTFLNNLTSSVGSSCTDVIVPLPFVSNNLTLPCFSSIINSISGASTLWTLVGTISSVLILYYYLKNLYKWIDNKLSMNEDNDWGGI